MGTTKVRRHRRPRERRVSGLLLRRRPMACTASGWAWNRRPRRACTASWWASWWGGGGGGGGGGFVARRGGHRTQAFLRIQPVEVPGRLGNLARAVQPAEGGEGSRPPARVADVVALVLVAEVDAPELVSQVGLAGLVELAPGGTVDLVEGLACVEGLGEQHLEPDEVLARGAALGSLRGAAAELPGVGVQMPRQGRDGIGGYA